MCECRTICRLNIQVFLTLLNKWQFSNICEIDEKIVMFSIVRILKRQLRESIFESVEQTTMFRYV
jgi:hypothetical protein